jgi:hypothetical protein
VGFLQLVAHASRLANIQENPPWPPYHINDNTLKTHDNTLKRAMEEQDSQPNPPTEQQRHLDPQKHNIKNCFYTAKAPAPSLYRTISYLKPNKLSSR